MPETQPQLLPHSPEGDERSLLFGFSASMFRMGLALVTFEQVRPFFDIQVSDYLFFLSLLLFLSRPKFRLMEAKASGALIAGSLILLGALLSLRNSSSLNDAAGPLARLFVLFGLFAALAVIHSKDIGKNLRFLIGGISVNCVIAVLQAWVFPGIVEKLSINPTQADLSYSGRFQGLTSHPNVLGLSAALAVLLGLELLTFDVGKRIRPRLTILVFVCILGALLSGSRTFFVALIPGLAVFAIMQRQHLRVIARNLVALIVLGAALTYFTPSVVSEYSERLASTGSDFAPDYGRIISAGLALVDISQKPIVGWGIDHIEDAGMWLNPETEELAGVHNSFLKYWYAAGIFGAAGFLAVFAVPTWQVLKALRMQLSDASKGTLPMALSTYALLFIVSNVEPIVYNRFLYVPMSVFTGYVAHLVALGRTRMVNRKREATNAWFAGAHGKLPSVNPETN